LVACLGANPGIFIGLMLVGRDQFIVGFVVCLQRYNRRFVDPIGRQCGTELDVGSITLLRNRRRLSVGSIELSPFPQPFAEPRQTNNGGNNPWRPWQKAGNTAAGPNQSADDILEHVVRL
jgi:hypothetical protein